MRTCANDKEESRGQKHPLSTWISRGLDYFHEIFALPACRMATAGYKKILAFHGRQRRRGSFWDQWSRANSNQTVRLLSNTIVDFPTDDFFPLSNPTNGKARPCNPLRCGSQRKTHKGTAVRVVGLVQTCGIQVIQIWSVGSVETELMASPDHFSQFSWILLSAFLTSRQKQVLRQRYTHASKIKWRLWSWKASEQRILG